jgi:hypothetical protein
VTTETITPHQARKALANDLAQASLDWFETHIVDFSFSDQDRTDLARALLGMLERRGL